MKLQFDFLDDPQKKKKFAIVLLVVLAILIIAGIFYNTLGKEDGKKEDPGTKQEQQDKEKEDVTTEDEKEEPVETGYTFKNDSVAPGIVIKSLNGSYNPESPGDAFGLSLQLTHKDASPENQIAFEVYGDWGATDAYFEGEYDEAAILSGNSNFVDRVEFRKTAPVPTEYLFWYPVDDVEEALLSVRVKKMATQNEFMRFGIVIKKNASGAYEISELKNIEMVGADVKTLSDIAYNSLDDTFKNLIHNRTGKVSVIGEIANQGAMYFEANGMPSQTFLLTGQIGVTFNFAEGLKMNPVTVYLDAETFEYLGYDHYEQVGAI